MSNEGREFKVHYASDSNARVVGRVILGYRELLMDI
jgi:hypothetical protein